MILSDEFTAVLGKREMLSAEHDVRYWREKARQLARPGRLAAARSASPPADQASYITAFSEKGYWGAETQPSL